VGTGDPMGDPYPHGYGYGGKSIPTSVYGWPDRVIFVSWVWIWLYEIVIPDGYLPIAISIREGWSTLSGSTVTATIPASGTLAQSGQQLLGQIMQ
jgi:hypothetical protein